MAKVIGGGDALAIKVLRLFDKMSVRENWDSTWDEIARYVVPDKNYVFERKSNTNTKGEERHNRLFDGTGEHSNGLLGSALHSLLTSPTQEFYDLSTGDPEIDRIPRVRKYLQKLVKLQHSILSSSNFQTEIHETYLDLGSFGTNVLRMEDDDEDTIRFFSMPIFEHYISENHKGVVDCIANQKEMSASDAIRKFKMESFGEHAKDIGKNLSKKLKIVNIVLPRDVADLQRIDSAGKAFVSIHVYVEGKKVISQQGFDEFPFAVPRWTKTSGEKYGRSPAMKALPDIRYVNVLKRTMIRANQKVIDPPLQVLDDGVIGRINLRPGGLTSVRSSGRDQRVIEPIITGVSLSAGREEVNDARDAIKQYFFVDQFQLPLINRMTTEEVSVRSDDRTRLLGPLVGRLNNELLSPMVNRLTGIMKRRDLLPLDMPEELRDRGLNVTFTSPIAQAQKLIEADKHGRWLASIAPLFESKPQVMDMLDEESYVRKMGELHGVDQSVLRSEKDLKELQAQRQQQQEQQQQIEDTVNVSQAVKNTENVLPLQKGT